MNRIHVRKKKEFDTASLAQGPGIEITLVYRKISWKIL